MRIISPHTCSECCYCMEDYDNEGLCCKDNIYKHIRMNQYACRCFCGDDEDINYYNDSPIDNDFDDGDDYDYYN